MNAEPAQYRSSWLALKQGPVSPDALRELSRQTALAFIDGYYQHGLYEPQYVDLLCEMATGFDDPALNNVAAGALFGLIVEKLCDDFEDLPVEAYCRVMSQVISYCRSTAAGAELDRTLSRFGIRSFDDLYGRACGVHTQTPKRSSTQPPQRIILLSRVTIGADVAILSVMIQRLAALFPQAEFVVIGGQTLIDIFGANPRLRVRRLHYSRRGGLYERFAAWHGTLRILADEAPPGSEPSTLLIDPDSRIAQLGVLPLTSAGNYLFFNSRNYAALPPDLCMGELANHWINQVFGTQGSCYPRVWLAPDVHGTAEHLIASLRSAGCRKTIAVNFGVGQNPRKRVGDDFERRLLLHLLQDPQTVVLLDKGFGREELAHSDGLAAAVARCGHPVVDMRFGASCRRPPSQGLVSIECRIGETAALIEQSDLYIGYDSARQHISAAVRTPTLTIFAGSNNDNFIRRWSAYGDTACRIVHVDTLTDPQRIPIEETILRIDHERRSMPPAARRRPQVVEVRSSRHPTEPLSQQIHE